MRASTLVILTTFTGCYSHTVVFLECPCISPKLGSESQSAQINGVVTACRGEALSLTCTHNNTVTGNTRWVVGQPVDCAETISSTVSPGQSCAPTVTFKDVSMLNEGIVSSTATLSTANTSVNGTVIECRDGAGIIFNSVVNVSICILG